MVQASMVPFYALITYVLFKSKDLYYAEALVMTVYMLGFMQVFIIPINALYYVIPYERVNNLEVIFLITYNTWTNLNFFKGKPVWWIIVKSIVSLIGCYLLFQQASNLVMDWLM